MRRTGHDIIGKSTNLETVNWSPLPLGKAVKYRVVLFVEREIPSLCISQRPGHKEGVQLGLEWPENGSDSPRYLRHESSHDHEYCR
jgi:hypothetical protein